MVVDMAYSSGIMDNDRIPRHGERTTTKSDEVIQHLLMLEARDAVEREMDEDAARIARERREAAARVSTELVGDYEDVFEDDFEDEEASGSAEKSVEIREGAKVEGGQNQKTPAGFSSTSLPSAAGGVVRFAVADELADQGEPIELQPGQIQVEANSESNSGAVGDIDELNRLMGGGAGDEEGNFVEDSVDDRRLRKELEKEDEQQPCEQPRRAQSPTTDNINSIPPRNASSSSATRNVETSSDEFAKPAEWSLRDPNSRPKKKPDRKFSSVKEETSTTSEADFGHRSLHVFGRGAGGGGGNSAGQAGAQVDTTSTNVTNNGSENDERALSSPEQEHRLETEILDMNTLYPNTASPEKEVTLVAGGEVEGTTRPRVGREA
eukprot:g1826.t1